MELKFVIPNMEKTFGNLEFAGEDKVVQRRINGRLTVLSRSYRLPLLPTLPTTLKKSMTFHQTSVMPVYHLARRLSCPIPIVKARTAWT